MPAPKPEIDKMIYEIYQQVKQDTGGKRGYTEVQRRLRKLGTEMPYRTVADHVQRHKKRAAVDKSAV